MQDEGEMETVWSRQLRGGVWCPTQVWTLRQGDQVF